jgi:hypothetical protein
MGGGTDVDAGFRWMLPRCNGGNFVVIRASGTDAYNEYIYNLGTSFLYKVYITFCRNCAVCGDYLDQYNRRSQ